MTCGFTAAAIQDLTLAQGRGLVQGKENRQRSDLVVQEEVEADHTHHRLPRNDIITININLIEDDDYDLLNECYLLGIDVSVMYFKS